METYKRNYLIKRIDIKKLNEDIDEKKPKYLIMSFETAELLRGEDLLRIDLYKKEYISYYDTFIAICNELDFGIIELI